LLTSPWTTRLGNTDVSAHRLKGSYSRCYVHHWRA
jgi:hypothetical protein